MTTCEPKYSTPTHRWISYAEFSYWAKVSDGIPQELASTDSNGKVKFVNNEKSSIVASVSSLKPWILGALAAYAIIFLSALVAWRWPYLADVRAGRREKPEFSLYGGLMRLQPGVLPIRLVLMALLIFARPHRALNGCSRGLRRIFRHCRKCRITRPCKAFFAVAAVAA